MKRIAILVPSLKSGGAEKQAALLACSLANYYRVHLIIFYGEVKIANSNMNIISSNPNLITLQIKGNIARRFYLLWKYLKNSQIDIAFNYLTFCDVYGSLAERIAGVNRIYNGIRNSRLPKSKMIAERIIHNIWVTGSIYNCYSGAEYFESKGFASEKNQVIPNCFPNIALPVKRHAKDTIKIITVGRFVPQKDYETAIRAISYLRNKNIRFVIVGYGELERSIRKWIEQYKIEELTSIYINPNNTQELLHDADIYLSTSIFEGTSNSIMEAMNWSLPVVATNVGDNKYLVHNNENGYIHKFGDADEIAKSLSKLIDDENLRNNMGRRGNFLLKEGYSVELFKKRYIDLINKMY